MDVKIQIFNLKWSFSEKNGLFIAVETALKKVMKRWSCDGHPGVEISVRSF